MTQTLLSGKKKKKKRPDQTCRNELSHVWQIHISVKYPRWLSTLLIMRCGWGLDRANNQTGWAGTTCSCVREAENKFKSILYIHEFGQNVVWRGVIDSRIMDVSQISALPPCVKKKNPQKKSTSPDQTARVTLSIKCLWSVSDQVSVLSLLFYDHKSDFLVLNQGNCCYWLHLH